MESAAEVSPQSDCKKLILCIDDHRQGLHARKLVLETAGYDVITPAAAGSGCVSSNGIPFTL